jgi:hypothetical protein
MYSLGNDFAFMDAENAFGIMDDIIELVNKDSSLQF